MIIILTIAISIIFCLISILLKTDSIHNFLTGDALTIMGVMLSINCASASNLHLKLVEYEEKLEEEVYNNTKVELKQNIIFSIISFLSTIFVFFIQDIVKIDIIKYLSDLIMMSLFLLQIYAVYEITVRFIFKIKPLY